MWIKELRLQDFRNYAYQKVYLSPQLNVVLGNNGEGKTNLLEAIYVLSTTRSHRTSVDKDLVRFGEKFYYLSGDIEMKTYAEKLEIGYSLERKYKLAKISGSPRKLSDVIGVLNVVLFSPEDLDLVKGSPANRRRFIDILLSQLDRKYLKDLQSYQKVLAQRNDCLKLIFARKFNADVLDMWDEQFVHVALQIQRTRLTAFEEMKPLFIEFAKKISRKENLRIEYQGTLSSCEDELSLLNKLKQYRQRDIQRGLTSFGPHRDDILFLIDGRSASNYASQGQQRTAVLALKLTELEYMKLRTGEFPVLLLDDVFSELDEHRRNALVNVLSGDVQSLLTGTRDTEVTVLSERQDVNLLHVEQGRVM